MTTYATEFRAICAKTGELRTWCGPPVEGFTAKMAQEWCYENAGHLVVVGELVAEIPCKKGTYAPDWEKIVEFNKGKYN